MPGLPHLFQNAVSRSLASARRAVIPFSGGVDSALIAAVAKKKMERERAGCGREKSEIFLVCVGAEEGSQDIEAAGISAAELGLGLEKRILSEARIIELYKKCAKIAPNEDFLKVELLVPLYECCEFAKEKGANVLVLGSGAEELFAGYDRHYDEASKGKDIDELLKKEFANLEKGDFALFSKLARAFGCEIRCPFMDKEFAGAALQIPASRKLGDRKMKKELLREVAKELGCPQSALIRPKKAMQYGSGIHRVLMRNRMLLG